ncbi:hypothetical protein SERLA73DRAFT_177089 [Serpula lacrymans var. lacrymans S7.3]|uniref:Uncharacterized protein n=2 Tax=Serpula lacrymans var. lacrymans TaxID=341189 RepID=F8PR07_SERL3|nr:uncharacterized protein SERLADRAFT_460517 [Serpula lacrymans var. lacrymans S7.9]EGO01664.1 hypothetical protein SERLA73DRAFT_177089 [Serpula lacrymans var. lacrymans S7.3]EGO27310.1 hypothetical protein SERLADRAFT_460517 [Serpula lacrymans var. lacrymans S7.9]
MTKEEISKENKTICVVAQVANSSVAVARNEDRKKKKQNAKTDIPVDTAETAPIHLRKKTKTSRAAAQFKSPLPSSGVASTPLLSYVRLTPAVQALERKLQLLKRAVKVKNGGEEDMLAALVKKWTEAGREVAWEVWEYVKEAGAERASEQVIGMGQKNIFQEGWGWEKPEGQTSSGDRDDGNWGWASTDSRCEEGIGKLGYDNDCDEKECKYEQEEDEEDRRRDTLGTMLRELHIAPETLGWDDDEENFVDG